MSEIEALEEITDLARHFKCPNRAGRLMLGTAISPQFERARAARPPKAVAVVTVAPTQVPADECAPPLPEITDYRSLVLCLRERADALDVSREAISELAGLPDRYAAKVLSLDGPKRIGMTSLGALLSALSIKLVAIVDDEALRRNRSRYVRRNESHTISAMRGHANVKPETLAAKDARMAEKKARDAVKAAEDAAIKAARMKAASRRERLKSAKRTPRK